MELKSKISIIVPIYNAELYLSRCLDSLINQSYKNIEVICVNDGSTDRSLEIAMTYSRQHSEIIVVNKCNTGVSDSRNVALQRATGDYVMFVDSDDWISPNMVKHLLKEAVTSNAELVMCGYSREYKDRTKDKIFDLPDRVVYEKDDLNQLHRQLFGPLNQELGNPESLDAIGTVWGKLYDMSILRKYDLKFVDLKIIGSNEDGLFNVEVFEYLTKVVFINQSLSH
ncbi:MAG: glycosyltransferase family 2 protein, partial [Turicibacter sp.]